MDDREERMARMREKFAQNPSWQRYAARRKKEAEERRRNATPPTERQEASIYAYRQFVQIMSRVVHMASYRDPEGYEQFLPPSLDGPTLAHHARIALAASRFVLPDHPQFDSLTRMPSQADLDASEAERRARAGVKTRSALYRDAGSVGLQLRDGQIEIAPNRYDRAGWWESIADATTVLPEDVDDETLGTAILDALATSRAAR